MSSWSELPPELWLYISRFIPNETIRQMVSVNKIFYSLALDIAYRNLELTKLTGETQRRLQRLQDPIVAERVQSLHVKPHLQEYGSRSAAPSSSSPVEAANRWNPLTVFQQAKLRLSRPKAERALDLAPSLELCIQLLIEVIPTLTSLVQLDIDAWDLPPSFDLEPFARAAWPSIGPQLQRLTLTGHLDVLVAFTQTKPILPSLQEFGLELLQSPYRPEDPGDAQVLLSSLVPFLNGLVGLKMLKISSWATLDISEIFEALRFFPQLHRVRLRVPFDKLTAKSEGLTQFLKSHEETLHRLELRLTPNRIALNPASEEPLSNWLASGLAAACKFTALRELQLYPTLLEEGLQALPAIIGPAKESLRTLSVRDRYLLFKEVQTIVSFLSGNAPGEGLRALRINIRTLSIEFLDDLHKHLPDLQTLTVYVGEAITDLALEAFSDGLRNRTFPSWRLYDIGISQGGIELDLEVMLLIAQAIPSIQSFWGNGNMIDREKTYWDPI